MVLRQFDVFENPASEAQNYAPYLVVLSSHLLHDLDDVVVAPLVNDARQCLSNLELKVEIENYSLTLVVSELSTLRGRNLRRHVGSLSDQEFDIRRALDRLFTGF